jgi:hypothetical protein
MNLYETDELGYYKHIKEFEELGEDWYNKPIGMFRMNTEKFL